MAHTKAGGSTKLGRDSQSKRLGVKLFGGQDITSGAIVVRQRGTKMIAGEGVAVGRDHTLYATRAGKVAFRSMRATKFTGTKAKHTVVEVK